jgi:hypothetical protein
MIILVSDTSVLIDLDRGGLLKAAFACGHQLVVPDYIYATELESENGPLLMEMGLKVVELTAEEVEFAQTIYAATPALSLADCFALSCARRPQHLLVTGDKTLRSRAEGNSVVCRGLLWILDQIEASEAIAPVSLAEGLQKISAHPRCRLPKLEVAERLAKWLR